MQGLPDSLPKEDALSALGARLQAWVSSVDAAVAKDPAAPFNTVMPEGGELGAAVSEAALLLGERQDLVTPVLQRILQRMMEVSGFRSGPLAHQAHCTHAPCGATRLQPHLPHRQSSGRSSQGLMPPDVCMRHDVCSPSHPLADVPKG